MKKIILYAFVCSLAFSCKKTANTATEKEVQLGDTIQTASGLSYYFIKKGNGRKIEEGSKVQVYTDLYINDADTTLWTTSTAADSLFTFYHQKTSLIEGFTEVHNYLSEGDEVVAIMPDSIAYGKEGRGTVPPSATLIYKPLIVKYVSEPKPLLSDTLYIITKTQSIAQATEFYDKIMASEEKNTYHTDIDLMVNDFLRQFTRDNLFAEQEAFANFLLTKTTDANYQRSLAFQAANAAEAQGKFKEAISYLEPWITKEPEEPYWQNKVNELKEKL